MDHRVPLRHHRLLRQFLRPVRPHDAQHPRRPGYISLNPAFGGGGIRLTGKAGDKTFDSTGTGKGHFQLALEGEHLAACIRSNTTPHSPGEEGLKDLIAIERIYQAAGSPIA